MKKGDRKYQYDFIVIGITTVIFGLIFLFSQINGERFASTLNVAVNFIYINFGWLLNICTLSCIFVAIYMMCSKYGNIRLGGKDAKPEFKTFVWWGMSLCAGMGMGIVFFPPAEVIEYTFRPAAGAGLVAGSYHALIWAMEQTMMHWTITLYSIYVVSGLISAYIYHNLKQPFSISAILYPLFGEKVYKYRSWIDGLVTFAIVGGVAGSFGYGILQVANGLNQLFGLPISVASWMVIGIGITLVYTFSSVSGLKKGIQWLADNNAKLFIAMLAFVALCGPTVFSLALGTESTGSMLNNFFKNMMFSEPMQGANKWSVWWNWLWYVDFFIFAPTTGFFLARLAKGRTIREFVTINMFAPGMFGMIWCWLFGGLAAHAQFLGGLDLNAIIQTRGIEAVMLTLFDNLPFSIVTKGVMLVVILISFITLANAVTSTVSKMSLRGLSREDDEQDSPPGIQIYWGFLMGGVALLFLVAGGFDGARAVKLLVGFPIVILCMFSLYGFMRMFIRKEYVEAEELETPEVMAEARARYNNEQEAKS